MKKAASNTGLTHQELLERGDRAISYGRQVREALDLTVGATRDLHEELEIRRQECTEDTHGAQCLAEAGHSEE